MEEAQVRTVVIKGRRKSYCIGKNNTCVGLATKTSNLCAVCKKEQEGPTPRSVLKQMPNGSIITFEGVRYTMRSGEVYRLCNG